MIEIITQKRIKTINYILTFFIYFIFATIVYSQECDESTRARMIKSGISDKAIEEQCGKIGEEENNSEKIEKTEDDLKISAKSKKPYQVQFILLSSLGSGISLYYNFKNDIWFGLDSQSTSGSASATNSSGIKSEANLNFSTNYLNARYYLFESMPSFFIQGGLVSRSWTIELVESRVSNNEKLGTYNTKYPSSAINIGLGWNWISDKGVSGGIHFIGLVGGSPLHTYEIESGWTCSDTCKADYETTIDELVPTATGHVNIGYNFNF
jgi:hypothetical protein